MAELIARILITIHRLVDANRMVHQWFISIVNRSVGEQRVAAALRALIRRDDVTWDVGANVGVYTRLGLEIAGTSGHVVAVDPVSFNTARLRELGPAERLTVVEAALSSSDGVMPLVISGKDGETSSLGEGPGAVPVRVARGDTLLGEGVPRPQVIKVDVEGFEGDVLEGMPDALSSVRDVLVEVHFAAMARQGRPSEPLRVLRLLRASGLSVRWIDPSHIVATRVP